MSEEHGKNEPARSRRQTLAMPVTRPWLPPVVMHDLDGGASRSSGGRPTRSIRGCSIADGHGTDRQHPGGYAEIGKQRIGVAEDPEVQRAKPPSLDEQQQVLHCHRSVGQPEWHHPVGCDLEPVACLVALGVSRGVRPGVGDRKHDHGRPQHTLLRRRKPSLGVGGLPETRDGIAGEYDEVDTLAVPGRGRTTRSVNETGDELMFHRIGGELSGHPPATDDSLDRHGVGRVDFLGQRAPSLSRSSAITQPCTTSEPPFFGLTVVNNVASSGLIFSGFRVS